jgi:hypothetical protein
MKMCQLLLASVVTLHTLSAFSAASITDQEAFDLGMTPVEETKSMAASDAVSFERSEYVSTIPSEDDIKRLIDSHYQVILINKQAKGKDAQTLRVYQNGTIKPLFENKVVTQTTSGKSTKTSTPEYKEFVKISTGTEAKKVSPTRTYVATTPKGVFRPHRIYTDYLSGTWNAQMPNAVFINCGKPWSEICGIAIHATGSDHYPELGTRASGGCVRTKLEVSKQIRELVMETGKGNRPGDFTVVKEAQGRNRIKNNEVSVDLVDRFTGGVKNAKVNSWDTLIVIYE